MIEIIAWIQNQDNSQRDLILKNGTFVLVSDETIREDATKRMFDIANKGRRIYFDVDFEIIRLKQIYLIKLQTLKQDANGQTLPMMILVENYQKDVESELNVLIDKTLVNSDYEIDPEYINQILGQLKKDLENQIKKKNFLMAGISLIFLITLLIIIKLIIK